MEKYLVVSLLLAALLAAAAKADWTYLGDYVEPYKTEGNVVTFTCTNAIDTKPQTPPESLNKRNPYLTSTGTGVKYVLNYLTALICYQAELPWPIRKN